MLVTLETKRHHEARNYIALSERWDFSTSFTSHKITHDGAK